MYDGNEKNVGQSGYHYSNHGHRYGGHGGGYFQGDSSPGSKTIVWTKIVLVEVIIDLVMYIILIQAMIVDCLNKHRT